MKTKLLAAVIMILLIAVIAAVVFVKYVAIGFAAIIAVVLLVMTWELSLDVAKRIVSERKEKKNG